MHNTLLNDYDSLGAAGGGTLELDAGVFQVNETLNFNDYGNVSIQGAGMDKTILSLPPSPIGTFRADNGSLVGLSNNSSLTNPLGGVTANFIQVAGPTPIDNFEMCNLAVDAQANNASEDWSGSLIYDGSGGTHHVYSDIAEDGFFGPSLTPNGLHLESSPQDEYPGVGYVIDDLFAENNTVPYENLTGFRAGPNFLNVGTVVNCTVDHVVGIGQVAFEVAPPKDCLAENWNISGHLTIDPLEGGSWGNTLFENVSVSTNGTAASIALGSEVPGDPGYETSNFTALRWNGDHFYGTVVGGSNLVDVENSTFDGELNSTPGVFEGNTVTWAHTSYQREALPIEAEGNPAGGNSSVLSGDKFDFVNTTKSDELFQLNVPTAEWTGDTFEVEGGSTSYLMSAPGVSLSEGSTLVHLAYEPLGGGAPGNLSLLSVEDSPGFTNLGAKVANLTLIDDNLPAPVAAPPGPAAGFFAWAVLGGAAAVGLVVAVLFPKRERRRRS